MRRGRCRATRSSACTLSAMETLASNRYLTAPNAFTLVRLCCIPVFMYLLLGRDNQIAAAWLLGGLGATDWVDGWLARRFNQTSEFGKMFDPIADRLLFIVGIAGIIIAGVAPLWVCWAVVVREILFGGTVAIATLFFDMKYTQPTSPRSLSRKPLASNFFSKYGHILSAT